MKKRATLPITFRFPPELLRTLRAVSILTGETMTSIACKAFEAEIKVRCEDAELEAGVRTLLALQRRRR